MFSKCAVPLALFFTATSVPSAAEEVTAATLRIQGHVMVDGMTAPAFSAIFANSQVETEKNSSAVIELTGTRIEVGPETMVEFDEDEFRLDHGSLSVLTFRSMTVEAGCVITTPVRPEETLFALEDHGDQITVAAIRRDVSVRRSLKNPKLTPKSAESDDVTVRQGEQVSRDERCGPAPSTRAVPGGVDGWLNSIYAKGLGAGLIGTGLCIALCKNDDPASPAKP